MFITEKNRGFAAENDSLPATIFCDFDGTITEIDAVDQLLAQYATPQWREIEALWEKGLIGSRECLERQIDCVGHFTQGDMDKFVRQIGIDVSFLPFLGFVRARQIPFHIVSDGFDLIIRAILARWGLGDLPLFCNHMALSGDRLKASFPFGSPDCEKQSGVCKCRVMQNMAAGRPVIYIGDGHSDICASRKADLLFAKGKLMEFCQDEGREFVPFENFEDIMTAIIKRNRYATEPSCVA
jgi:2,3-diketo-5-methylthio-1-phosphopentane phosphatase